MSTYTDLQNKIKETIVVGYRPDDRITTQKIKFFNKENEYYGIFMGKMIGEDVLINSGEIKNITISNSDISKSTFKIVDENEKVISFDLNYIYNTNNQLSTDIKTLQDKLSDLNFKIDQLSAILSAPPNSI